jgi:3-oxoacyl-[acyl-carrier-protein] synthase II
MQMAMKKSGLALSDIDYINAHGTSTPLGDELELGACAVCSATRSAICR